MSAERPTTNNIKAIKRKVPPTNPDQIFGLNDPVEKNVHNKIDPNKILIIRKKRAIKEKNDNGL